MKQADRRLVVHIVTHNDMDGFLWGVLEGWLNTGVYPEGLNVHVAGPNTLLRQSKRFWETLPGTDAILFCVTSAKHTNAAKAIELIEKHGLWKKTIYHDYVHDDKPKLRGVCEKAAVSLIGKRYKWLKIKDSHPHSRWLPRTGIQDRTSRYRAPLPWAMYKDIPAIAVYHTFKPAQYHRLPWMGVVHRALPGAVVGAVPREERTHPLLSRVYGDRHSSEYLELAARSRIGVYLMGGTALGHQFWEFAALECAILAMHPRLHPQAEEDTQEWEHFDPPLIEGEDFFYFKSEKELAERLVQMKNNPAACERMAARVWKKVQPYRSAVRGGQIYDLIQRVAKAEPKEASCQKP